MVARREKSFYNGMREQHGPIEISRSADAEFGRNLPRRFGNYVLERTIATGGMGEVFYARQRTAFNREVAIKIIRSDLVHDMTARRRFLREAEVHAHIKHEHILPLYEFNEEEDRLFLVTPYIATGTLADRLHRGPLMLAETQQIFVSLVQAVAYIHRRGVVHRDLKPSNILLDQEENSDRVYVRLIDFGIATIQGETASPPLTTAGTEMGTLAYMAPERMSGIAAPSNDIYSLGVILHQMLTGRYPDEEPKIALPRQLDYVVNHCLAPRQEERFTSAEDLLSAFEYACQSLLTPIRDSATAAQRARTTTGTTGTVTGAHAAIGDVRDARDATGNVKTGARTATRGDTSAHPSRPPRAPQRPDAFVQGDYGAPTVNFDVRSLDALDSLEAPPISPVAPQATAVKPPHQPRPPRQKKRRNPLVAIITILIVVVLLVMAGMFYFEFQTVVAPTATINLGPQIRQINTVFHITAQPSLKTSNVATATIPAKLLNESKTDAKQGPTTGQTCFLGVFNCQQTVSETDVNALSVQLRQTLETQINADLTQQLQAANGSAIGTMQFSDVSLIPNPPVGSLSDTVTVTMTEQGSLNYYNSLDAQNLVRQLLQQQATQFGPNYALLSSTELIGQPVITGLNSQGVQLSISAGADVQYSIPSSQIHDIANHIKDMSQQAALAYIKQQPGIDPATVAIHISTGTTMPASSQQITIIPLNPTSIPMFNLPTVTPMPSPSPSATSTPATQATQVTPTEGN